MAPAVRVLDPKTRAALTLSTPIPSTLKPVPVVDRKTPRWDAADTHIRAYVELSPSVDPTVQLDLALEGTDDPAGSGPWYTLVAATGIAAVASTRDGSLYRPSISFASTTVTAKHLRLVVEPNKSVRFSATIEVT